MLIPLQLQRALPGSPTETLELDSEVVGVGVDVVDVADVSRSLDVGGHAYLRHLLSSAETTAVNDLPDPHAIALRVAECFALKECVTKILDPHDAPWPWRLIDVGAPHLVPHVRLAGAARQRARALRLTDLRATIELASATTPVVIASAVGLRRLR